MRKYKAIFFDWDGTAVASRKAAPDDVIGPMKALLARGVPLVIISGTTYENIAGGRLESYFTAQELQNLFLGLARGAYNYRYDEAGKPFVWSGCMPDKAGLLNVHAACFDIHQRLLREHGLPTDIVFSRPNYCKIDLVVESNRGDQLFMQGGEIDALKSLLREHGIGGGLQTLLRMSGEAGAKYGLRFAVTCDAKRWGLPAKATTWTPFWKCWKPSAGYTRRSAAFGVTSTLAWTKGCSAPTAL